MSVAIKDLLFYIVNYKYVRYIMIFLMASLFIYFVQYMHASHLKHFQHLVSCCVFYLVVFEFQVIVVANDDDGETSHRTQLDFEFKVNLI